MESKNISIRKDIYKKLKNLKKQNESISDVIERLINEGSKGTGFRLMKYFGAWEDLPEIYDQIVRDFHNSFYH